MRRFATERMDSTLPDIIAIKDSVGDKAKRFMFPLLNSTLNEKSGS
jgi:hypothetical protein